jgi:tetratricopeptide (TPR) repeat protein
MAFLTRHLWAITWITTAVACALFAAVFYPRDVDIDERLAYAAERKAADDILQQGMKAYAKGNRERARRLTEEALALVEDDYQTQIMIGLLEFDDGNLERAEGHFDRACSLWEVDPDARNSRGVTRWMLGDQAGAIRDFSRAIALNPEFNRAQTNRGLAYLAMGDRDRARDDFEASMEDEKEPSAAPRAVLGLGILSALRGDYDQAESSFSLLLARKRPREIQMAALANRAKVYEALGNGEMAARDRKALEELERSTEDADGADPEE